MFHEPKTTPNTAPPRTSSELVRWAIPNVQTSLGKLYDLIDSGRGKELSRQELNVLELHNPSSNRNLIVAIERNDARCLSNK